MISENEYLFLCLAEECAEIQQICSKIIRFGLNSYHPDDPDKIQNFQKLKNEINDFIAVTDYLKEIIPEWNGEVENKKLVLNKIKKIDHYMEISKELGKLKIE